MVATVGLFADTNATADSRVREAFQMAMYVSTGIDKFNVEVARPKDTEMCGVGITPEITDEDRRVRRLSIESEHKRRREEEFGVGDVRALKLSAEYALSQYHEKIYGNNFDSHSFHNIDALALDDITVTMGIVSNVDGKNDSYYIFSLLPSTFSFFSFFI